MKRLYNHKERVNGMITLTPLKIIQRNTPPYFLDGVQLSDKTEERLTNTIEWDEDRPEAVNYVVDGEKIKVLDLARKIKISLNILVIISKIYKAFTISNTDVKVVTSKRDLKRYDVEDSKGIVEKGLTIDEIANFLNITVPYAYVLKKRRTLYQNKYIITVGSK